MQLGMQEALKDKKVTPEMQQQIAMTSDKISQLIRDEFSWKNFEPTLMAVYRKSFSQSDVDGMIAFYKTEAGQSVIKKMPIVMQNTMQLTQERMKVVLPQIMQITEESIAVVQQQHVSKSRKK